MNQALHLRQVSAHKPFDDVESTHQHAISSFIQAHQNFYARTLTVGHVTASAWIINPACTHALLLHHKKLDRWLQPGGHIESDPDVLTAALREAREETGITSLEIVNKEIFDLDIHTIPENKKEPEHQHYDIRYLFKADLNAMPTISDESNDVRWFALDAIASSNDEASIQRMILKTIHLRESDYPG